MGKKKQKYNRHRIKLINKNLLVVFSIILLAVFVIATAPTVPTSQTPVNNSITMNGVSLTCSGSTDAESDPITYDFRYGTTVGGVIDNFNRADSGTIGNGWTETEVSPTGDMQIRDNRLEANVSGAGDNEVRISRTASKLTEYSFEILSDHVSGNNFAGIRMWDGDVGSSNVCFSIALNNDAFYFGSTQVNTSSADTWYNLSAQNVNWSSYTFDAYINGVYNTTGYFNYNCTTGQDLEVRVSGTGGQAINALFDNIEGSSIEYGTSGTFNISDSFVNGTTYYWDCRACDNNSECSEYTSSRTISRAHFYNCSSGNIALNLTYQNESDSSNMDATIDLLTFDFTDDLSSTSYSFTGTEGPSQSFCIDPNNLDLATSGTIRYSATGFPERQVSFSNTLNGNDTLAQTLYLLPTADGIYVTFQVVDTSGAPIEDVTVTAKTVIDGTLTDVGGGETDAAGVITLWLNPNAVHTISASKSGVGSLTTSITPTQSLYTLTLSTTSTTNQTSAYFGITYNILPTDVILNNNTVYDFIFNISSSDGNLTSYGFQLYNASSGALLNSTSGNTATGEVLTVGLDTITYQEIQMDYWWITEDGGANQSQSWLVRSTYQGSLSIKQFFDDFAAYAAVGFGAGYSSFGNILLSILIIVGVTTSLSYAFGLYSKTGITAIIAGLVLLLEYVNLLPPLIFKYFLSAIVGAMLFAFILEERTR